VEQELLTLPEHLSQPPVFSGVHVTQSLVLYVCFVDCCLSFCIFSFGHCVVCYFSILDQGSENYNFEIKICLSGATCLPADFCFS
jgi:hypothetical protein